MNRKEKRDRKNANHRRNERRRHTLKMFKNAEFLRQISDAASAAYHGLKSIEWD